MRLILAMALLAIASPAAAQVEWLPIPEDEPRREDRRPPVKEWHIGFDAGVARFDPSRFQGRTSRVTLFAERQMRRWVGLQGDGMCSTADNVRPAGAPRERTGYCAGFASAIFPFEVHRNLWPYLRVGGGVAFWDERAVEGTFDVDDAAWAAVLGAGIRSYPGNAQRVGMRLDFQWQQSSLQRAAVGNWSVGVGVTLRFPRE